MPSSHDAGHPAAQAGLGQKRLNPARFKTIPAEFLWAKLDAMCKNCSHSLVMGIDLSVRPTLPRESRASSRLSLVFRRGERPSAADVARLSRSRRTSVDRAPGFAVSYRPDPADWLELLADGMTFDLVGLAPAVAAPIPPMAHFYGFSDNDGASVIAAAAEAITLIPGDHLHGAENLLPVMLTMAGLATHLVALAGVAAVAWHPARCAMAPEAFAAAITRWRKGGAFPALGLTALSCDGDGAVRSEGLAFFIGQELWIDPLIGENAAARGNIATRLINQLVGSHSIHHPFETTGPNGETISVVPAGNDGILRVWRQT